MKAYEKGVLLPVTIGSILERYEIYLYIYWTPIISKNFFDLSLPITEFVNFILVLIVGLISRPLGGIVFGYVGDRWGRKNAFLVSIILISIPSFFTALMPTSSTWSLFYILYIGLMKFIQGIPAGGELPGAMCYLAEVASSERKRYLCSYVFVGPQIGQIISMVQCLLLEKYLSPEALIHWGWRLSFCIGGLIGILGYFLRKKLHESPAFQDLIKKHEVLHNPVKEAFKNYKGKISLGFLISIFEVVGFYMIAFFLVENAGKILKLNVNQILLIYILFLTPLIVIQPLIGKIGDRYKNKPLYFLSAIGIILLSFPFYLTIVNASTFWALTVLGLLTLFYSIQLALLPSLITDLYPTPVRFTCIGFSFNVCDSVIGGITPLLGVLLVQMTGNLASFIIIYPVAAIIFLIALSFVKIKEPSFSNR